MSHSCIGVLLQYGDIHFTVNRRGWCADSLHQIRIFSMVGNLGHCPNPDQWPALDSLAGLVWLSLTHTHNKTSGIIPTSQSFNNQIKKS